MPIAALVMWVLAALVGGYLLVTWVIHGGLRRTGERPSRFAPQLIFGHASLAATGLVVWIAYLVLRTTTLAWTALGVLVVVAVLGSTMFTLWLGGRPRRSRGRHAAVPRHMAESNFPSPAVVGHGLFALAAVTLVLVSAVQATR